MAACGAALHWTASRSCRRGGMLFGTSAPSSHDSLTSDTSVSGAPRLRMLLSCCRKCVAVCPTAGGFATFSIPKPSIWLWCCPPSGTASPTIRTEERASAYLCRRLAPPAATALASRPRPGTYTNAPYACDPTSQPPGAPHPTAVWHGKLAMWASAKMAAWTRRRCRHATPAASRPRRHKQRVVRAREEEPPRMYECLPPRTVIQRSPCAAPARSKNYLPFGE